MLDAPETVPVYHRGERVADAHFREGVYAFTLLDEVIDKAVNAGRLHLWPRFVDHFVSVEGAMVRHYFAIEIVEIVAPEASA